MGAILAAIFGTVFGAMGIVAGVRVLKLAVKGINRIFDKFDEWL